MNLKLLIVLLATLPSFASPDPSMPGAVWGLRTGRFLDEVRVSIFGIFRPVEVQVKAAGKDLLRVTVVAEDGRSRNLSTASLRLRCGDRAPVFLETGKINAASGRVEVRPHPKGGLLEVGVTNGPRREYAGWVEIRESAGTCRLINHVPLEAYSQDVACREICGAGPQALKAQAVAVRSYALSQLGRHGEQGFDFCDLTHCQVYTGQISCSPGQRDTLKSVSGLTLLYQGRPAETYYFSTCGGHTASAAAVWGELADRAYLRGVADSGRLEGWEGDRPYCAESEHLQWRLEIDQLEVCRRLRKFLRVLGEVPCAVVVDRVGPGKWVQKVAVRGDKTLYLEGERFHLLMGRFFGWGRFKSARFRVESQGGKFMFSGRGMGHGVGMCQHGAMGMERAGADYRTILQHYFPGTELVRWP